MTHEIETAVCVSIRGQGRELDPEESTEIEMYTNPPNSRGGICVTLTSALGLGCLKESHVVGRLNGKDPGSHEPLDWALALLLSSHSCGVKAEVEKSESWLLQLLGNRRLDSAFDNADRGPCPAGASLTHCYLNSPPLFLRKLRKQGEST